jgi:hypothetical protein
LRMCDNGHGTGRNDLLTPGYFGSGRSITVKTR